MKTDHTPEFVLGENRHQYNRFDAFFAVPVTRGFMRYFLYERSINLVPAEDIDDIMCQVEGARIDLLVFPRVRAA